MSPVSCDAYAIPGMGLTSTIRPACKARWCPPFSVSEVLKKSGHCQVKAPESSVTRLPDSGCQGYQNHKSSRQWCSSRCVSFPETSGCEVWTSGASKVSGCEVQISRDVALVATSLHRTRLPVKNLLKAGAWRPGLDSIQGCCAHCSACCFQVSTPVITGGDRRSMQMMAAAEFAVCD